MINRLFSDIDPPRMAHVARRPYLIEDGVEIEGELRVDGGVRIEGSVIGRIQARSVLIAKSGEVHGVVTADEVLIEGLSTAEVYAKRIVLRPGCSVTGEIYHEELSIEPLAHFEGKSRRFLNPQRLAPQKVEIVDEEPSRNQPSPGPLQIFDRVA